MSAETLGGALPGRELLRVFAPHLAALLLPLLALVFLLTAPHGWLGALAIVFVPGLAMQLADRYAVARHDEGLAAIERSHDAAAFVPQLALGDHSCHSSIVARVLRWRRRAGHAQGLHLWIWRAKSSGSAVGR